MKKSLICKLLSLIKRGASSKLIAFVIEICFRSVMKASSGRNTIIFMEILLATVFMEIFTPVYFRLLNPASQRQIQNL